MRESGPAILSLSPPPVLPHLQDRHAESTPGERCVWSDWITSIQREPRLQESLSMLCFLSKYYSGALGPVLQQQRLHRNCTCLPWISMLLSQCNQAKVLAVCTHKCKHTPISNYFALLLALRSCQQILKTRMLSGSAYSGDTSTARRST